MKFFELTIDQYDSRTGVQFYNTVDSEDSDLKFENDVKNIILKFIKNLPDSRVEVENIFNHVVDELYSYGYNRIEKTSINIYADNDLHELCSHWNGKTNVEKVKDKFINDGCKFLNKFLSPDEVENIILHNSRVDQRSFLENFKVTLLCGKEPRLFEKTIENILTEYNIDFSQEMLDQVKVDYTYNKVGLEKIEDCLNNIFELYECYCKFKNIKNKTADDINLDIDYFGLDIEYYNSDSEFKEDIKIFSELFKKLFNEDI